MSNLRVSHVGGPGAWSGVIKDGKRVVWTCPHKHPNRDYSTINNMAARECAGYVVLAATVPERAEAMLKAAEAMLKAISTGPSATARPAVIECWKRTIAWMELATSVAAEVAHGETRK